MADAQGPAVSHHDSGAVVVGWFAKIAVTLALVGSLAFDGVSIAIARAHVNDVASDSADAAVAGFVRGGEPFSPTAALTSARNMAVSEGGTLATKDLVITRTGHTYTIKVTVHYVAGTALLGHLPGTDGIQQAVATATRTVSS